MSNETLLTIVQMQIRQTLISRYLGKQPLVGSCVVQRQRRASPELCIFTRRAVPHVLSEQAGLKHFTHLPILRSIKDKVKGYVSNHECKLSQIKANLLLIPYFILYQILKIL